MIISPKYDYFVKELFHDTTVLRHFIGDVMGIPQERIRSVRLKNTFLRKGYRKQKEGILDVRERCRETGSVGEDCRKEPVHRGIPGKGRYKNGQVIVCQENAHMVLNTKGKVDFKMFRRKDYSRMPEEKCPLIFRIVGMVQTITKPLRQIYEEELMYVRDERYFIICECNRAREAVGLESMTPEEEDNIPGLPKWPLFVRVVWAVQRITAPLTMPLKLWFDAELKRWRDDQAWRSYVWEEARMAAKLKYETLRKAEIKIESILSILEEYGPVPDGLRAKIMSETDLDTLHEWIRMAARSESVEEFEKKIAA